MSLIEVEGEGFLKVMRRPPDCWPRPERVRSTRRVWLEVDWGGVSEAAGEKLRSKSVLSGGVKHLLPADPILSVCGLLVETDTSWSSYMSTQIGPVVDTSPEDGHTPCIGRPKISSTLNAGLEGPGNGMQESP